MSHVDATSTEASFEDSVMKVNYIPIMPSENMRKLPRSATNSPVEEDITNYYSREKVNPGSDLYFFVI